MNSQLVENFPQNKITLFPKFLTPHKGVRRPRDVSARSDLDVDLSGDGNRTAAVSDQP